MRLFMLMRRWPFIKLFPSFENVVNYSFIGTLASLNSRLVVILSLLESGKVQKSVDCLKRITKVLPTPSEIQLTIAKDWVNK